MILIVTWFRLFLLQMYHVLKCTHLFLWLCNHPMYNVYVTRRVYTWYCVLCRYTNHSSFTFYYLMFKEPIQSNEKLFEISINFQYFSTASVNHSLWSTSLLTLSIVMSWWVIDLWITVWLFCQQIFSLVHRKCLLQPMSISLLCYFILIPWLISILFIRRLARVLYGLKKNEDGHKSSFPSLVLQIAKTWPDFLVTYSAE